MTISIELSEEDVGKIGAVLDNLADGHIDHKQAREASEAWERAVIAATLKEKLE